MNSEIQNFSSFSCMSKPKDVSLNTHLELNAPLAQTGSYMIAVVSWYSHTIFSLWLINPKVSRYVTENCCN